MKIVFKSGLVAVAIGLSGIVMACNVRAMPPFKVDVSLWSIAVQWAQGASNPFSAAFLNELDSMGSTTFGSSGWKADNFVGYVYPKTSVGGMSGVTQVFVDKPCGKTAKEGAENEDDGGGAGGGVEGGGGGGGNNPSGGSPPSGGSGGGGPGGIVIVGPPKSTP